MLVFAIVTNHKLPNDTSHNKYWGHDSMVGFGNKIAHLSVSIFHGGDDRN
jgi:hypothetical protein